MGLRRLYAWACERLYAEWAWSYDWVSWWVSGGQWARWQALALDYVQGTPVLELGFGTGELLPKLAEKIPLTVGLELSTAMQQQTARKLRARGVGLPRVQARAQAMPFPANTFDTLIATFPAPYILEPATLHECARVLRAPTDADTTTFGASRLVIVGLWVALAAQRWTAWIPLFYGRPSPQALQQLATRLAAAGFRANIEERAVGIFRVGVVIAERIGTQPHG